MSHPVPIIQITASVLGGARRCGGEDPLDLPERPRCRVHAVLAGPHRPTGASAVSAPGLRWPQLFLVVICGFLGVASGAYLTEQILSRNGGQPRAGRALAAPFLCLTH